MQSLGGPLLPDFSPLPLRQATPDAELLPPRHGILEAIDPHLALGADLLGSPSRCAAVREEEIVMGAETVGVFLPTDLLNGKRINEFAPQCPPLLTHAQLRHCNIVGTRGGRQAGPDSKRYRRRTDRKWEEAGSR